MGDGAIDHVVTGYALDALAIGVIVADCDGRVTYSNVAADRLLSDKTGALQVQGGKICAARHETQCDLQAIIVKACLRGTLIQAGSNYMLAPSMAAGHPDLTVCVLPFETAGPFRTMTQAMLLVRKIERDCNLEMEGRRLFGLTKSEAKFASSLAAGQSLKEAAKIHEVTSSTARSHMKNIFRKTGVSRQSQVAALLRGAQIPVEAR